MVLIFLEMIISFCHSACVWQTERNAIAKSCVAYCSRTVKKSRFCIWLKCSCNSCCVSLCVSVCLYECLCLCVGCRHSTMWHHIMSQTGTNRQTDRQTDKCKNITWWLRECMWRVCVLRAASSLCVRLAHVNTGLASTVAVGVTAWSLTHTQIPAVCTQWIVYTVECVHSGVCTEWNVYTMDWCLIDWVRLNVPPNTL